MYSYITDFEEYRENACNALNLLSKNLNLIKNLPLDENLRNKIIKHQSEELKQLTEEIEMCKSLRNEAVKKVGNGCGEYYVITAQSDKTGKEIVCWFSSLQKAKEHYVSSSQDKYHGITWSYSIEVELRPERIDFSHLDNPPSNYPYTLYYEPDHGY
jgi:hypothetical protein